MAEPGLTPKSPVREDGPVLVTVEAPRTAKFRAVPMAGAVCAQALLRQPSESSRTAAIKHLTERLRSAIVLHVLSIPEFHEADRGLAMVGIAVVSVRLKGISESSLR